MVRFDKEKRNIQVLAGHERLDTTGVRGQTPYPCRIQSFWPVLVPVTSCFPKGRLLFRVLARMFSLDQYGF